MELSLQLFGYLILTFLGIVVPFLIVLLSIFQEGALRLIKQYENEFSKSQANLESQMSEQSQVKVTDVEKIEQSQKEIKKSIKEIKRIKKIAENKLSYLNAKRQMLRLFIILLISFLSVIVAILTKAKILLLILFTSVSIVFFIFALLILWKLLSIIIEVKRSSDKDKKEDETVIKELLSTIAQRGEAYFLKKVFIKIENELIDKKGKQFIFGLNTKSALRIGIKNNESRMAKNIMFSLNFPLDFIIEKEDFFEINTNKEGVQQARFAYDTLHGESGVEFPPLIFKSIKKGNFEIISVIKAENIEPYYEKVVFKIEKIKGIEQGVVGEEPLK